MTENLEGKKFYRLTAIKYLGKDKYFNQSWLCVCDCGKKTHASLTQLKRGKKKSCGCLQKELAGKNGAKQLTTHGLSRDIDHKKTRLYRIWNGIKNRCLNKNVSEYPNYGGRGILICEEWKNDFKAFYDWANNNGYDDSLSIDRIDNDGNYEPSNCRWATNKSQTNNRRTNTIIELNGVEKTLSEWADKYGISSATILERLKRGWEIKDAITKPIVSKDKKLKVI